MTKKNLFIALLSMLVCVGFTSCGGDDEEDEYDLDKTEQSSSTVDSIILSEYGPFNFAASGGSVDITINASSSWRTIVTGDSYIKVNPSTGSEGTSKVKITVSSSKSVDREGSVDFVLLNGKKSKLVRIKQKH